MAGEGRCFELPHILSRTPPQPGLAACLGVTKGMSGCGQMQAVGLIDSKSLQEKEFLNLYPASCLSPDLSLLVKVTDILATEVGVEV